MKLFFIFLITFLVFSFSGCSSSQKFVNERNLETSFNSNKKYVSVSAYEFNKLLSSKENNYVLLDVRTKEEFNEEHIEGAVLLDFYLENFDFKLSQLDKNKIYFVYCRSGNRSGQTLEKMKELGFKNVYNLKGGINDWKKQNYKLLH